MGVQPNKMDKIYPDIAESNAAFEENPSRSCPDLYIKNRRPTDVCFFVFFALFFSVLFGLIGYSMYYGDYGRILNGYDNCGSVCGKVRKNDTKNATLQACYKARDEATKFGPFYTSLVEEGKSRRVCLDKCVKGYEPFFHRCLPDKNTSSKITNLKYILVEISEDFEISWKPLMYSCLVSLACSLSILVLFRYFVGCVVWIILISVEAACCGASCALWALWIQRSRDNEVYDEERKLWLHLGLAVGATALAIIVGLIIFVMRKQIELVVQLFTEAGKAISDMSWLLLEPLWTVAAFAVTISCWIYCCIWIASAGRLDYRGDNDFYYKKDGWIKSAAVLSAVGMLWMIQFIIGCQHMIVAGAVSKWYFTRDKSELSSPITESAYNLTRYHLGSVAVGSFITTVIKILKYIVAVLQHATKEHKNSYVMCLIKACLCLCSCCLSILDWIVKIFSENAYIMVAMYGYPFFKAGRQAFVRIAAHPLSFAAINSVGDFVLFLAKVMVLVVAETSAMYLLKDKGIQHMWVFLILVGLFSVLISHFFITLYEMTIDTIFICFCEDSELNDGLSKPYYMSRGLMEYVDNSKKALEAHDRKKINEMRQLKENEVHTVSSDVETKNKHPV